MPDSGKPVGSAFETKCDHHPAGYSVFSAAFLCWFSILNPEHKRAGDVIQQHILIIEDDVDLAELIAEYLAAQDFCISVVHRGDEGLNQIRELQPDLVILDVMLPGLKGTEVCRQARADYRGMILMLTALDDQMDQMLTLELGADDYVVKPVPPRLLLARVHALLRRSHSSSSADKLLSYGDIHLQLENRSVSIRDHNLDLTPSEYDLLKILLQAHGTPVNREQLVSELRGFSYDGFDRSIDRRISRLRKKLSFDGLARIKTIRGEGYLLLKAAEADSASVSRLHNKD